MRANAVQWTVIAVGVLGIAAISAHFYAAWNFICPATGKRLTPEELFTIAANEQFNSMPALAQSLPLGIDNAAKLLAANPGCCSLKYPWASHQDGEYLAWSWPDTLRPTWRHRLYSGGWAEVEIGYRISSTQRHWIEKVGWSQPVDYTFLTDVLVISRCGRRVAGGAGSQESLTPEGIATWIANQRRQGATGYFVR